MASCPHEVSEATMKRVLKGVRQYVQAEKDAAKKKADKRSK